jgi:glutamyl-tRNA reductase
MRPAVQKRSDLILLETCHRVELYGFGPLPVVDPELEPIRGREAVLHVMRVAAGLESAIVGEDEVLHQVRQALAIAMERGALDGRLQRLFEVSIAVGRRARARRSHASGNLAQRAVAWLGERIDLDRRQLLIVGSGHMGAAIAHAAASAHAELTIASRHAERAARLASVYGAASTDLAGAARLVGRSAAVAVALSGPWSELASNAGALPPIADISAPPAVPEGVSSGLDGSYLCIDDLYVRERPVDAGYASTALPLIEAKTAEFEAWLDSRP